jgi:hypothetical protein
MTSSAAVNIPVHFIVIVGSSELKAICSKRGDAGLPLVLHGGPVRHFHPSASFQPNGDRSHQNLAVAQDPVPRSGLQAAKPRAIPREVLAVVREWRQIARHLRLSPGTLSAYTNTFKNALADESASPLKT